MLSRLRCPHRAEALHVTRVMDANAEAWNANTKNDFATAVQRAFNWAERQGLIDRNPLRHSRNRPGGKGTGHQPGPVCQDHGERAEPNFRRCWKWHGKPVPGRRSFAKSRRGTSISAGAGSSSHQGSQGQETHTE